MSRHTVIVPAFGLVLLVFLYLSLPFSLSAQFGIAERSASLTVTPNTPLPESPVTVGLSAYAIDQNGATIRWYVNGVEEIDARDMREITIMTGTLGNNTSVRAVLTPQNGVPISVTRVIEPSALDIIIEADTYVPDFYKGRTLPTPGSDVRVIAVPHLSSPRSDLYYTWTINREVLGGGPIKGQDVVTFTMPRIGNPLLSVKVSDANGTVLASRILELEAAAPEIHFYEENELRGSQGISIDDAYTLENEEITIIGEPYFVSSALLKNNEAIEWRIDGTMIENPQNNKQRLTLRKTGGAGSAMVEFQIKSREALQQRGVGSFRIFFDE